MAPMFLFFVNATILVYKYLSYELEFKYSHFSEASVSAVGQTVLNGIIKYNSVYMACVKYVP